MGSSDDSTERSERSDSQTVTNYEGIVKKYLGFLKGFDTASKVVDVTSLASFGIGYLYRLYVDAKEILDQLESLDKELMANIEHLFLLTLETFFNVIEKDPTKSSQDDFKALFHDMGDLLMEMDKIEKHIRESTVPLRSKARKIESQTFVTKLGCIIVGSSLALTSLATGLMAATKVIVLSTGAVIAVGAVGVVAVVAGAVGCYYFYIIEETCKETLVLLKKLLENLDKVRAVLIRFRTCIEIGCKLAFEHSNWDVFDELIEDLKEGVNEKKERERKGGQLGGRRGREVRRRNMRKRREEN